MFRTIAVLAIAACLSSTTATAQPAAGPTMDATKAWLESDGREMMRANRLQTDHVHFAVTAGTDEVESIALNECTLLWRTVRSYQITTTSRAGSSQVSPLHRQTLDFAVVLRDLSVGSISVEPDTFETDAAVYAVRLVIRQQLGASSTRSIDSGNQEAIRAASLPVQTAEDGQRIANAIKRATVLCGVATSGVF